MTSPSNLEQLPTEIIYVVLSHLVHPRSRLPGLTERQSDHDCPVEEKKAAKDAYHLSRNAPLDVDRFAENLFVWHNYQHPFNVLALTCRRLRDVTERFCAHLVKACNRFNLLISQAEEHGPRAVYPSLNDIVFRRLWLQYAPRYCVFCNALLSSYPHRITQRVLVACQDCFYAQVYTINEVEEQLHISRMELGANRVRGSPTSVLRVDVEALALRVYGTKRYHDLLGQRQPCGICLQAGTLARIMALRAQRESQIWLSEPNTDGWIVTQRGSQIEQSNYKWFQYISYRKDLYLYKDDEFQGGYHLRSRNL